MIHGLLFCVLGFWSADDPTALVLQLGSPRYAARESATRALEELGIEAIPALRIARQDPDPEVRSRADALVDRIETDLMTKPTEVRLDYKDRTLGEIVVDLSRQTRTNFQLVPENHPAWASKRFTLQESEPVTFWEAIDRLGRATGVSYSPQLTMFGGAARGRQPGVSLVANGTYQPPTFFDDSGPFRVTLVSIHHHRDRSFGSAAALTVTQGVVPQPRAGSSPAVAIAASQANDQFYANVQVLAEPRLVVGQQGAVRLIEAIDDRDQSLLLPPPSKPEEASARVAAFSQAMMGGMHATMLQATIPLKYPATPGAKIKRLRGAMPLQVLARKQEPLTIALDASSKGKSFSNADLRITIHEIRAEPVEPMATLELSIQPLAPPNPGSQPGLSADFFLFRMPGQPQSPLEIVDAQGKLYAQWFPYNVQTSATGQRMSLRVMRSDGIGPPAQLRVYELARASTEASFEFRDIPMP